MPTMGALHEGHLSLVRDGKMRGDRVVVSLFVNPTQFAPQEDFAGYPRDFERDRRLLTRASTSCFIRRCQKCIRKVSTTRIEIRELSAPLCGAVRPGHFRAWRRWWRSSSISSGPMWRFSAARITSSFKSFAAWCGTSISTSKIIGHPTVREADGLAMSSRNAYLNPEESARRLSACTVRSVKPRNSYGAANGAQPRSSAGARGEIAREPLARIEYVSLCDPESLREIDLVQDAALLALAVRIGKARLIDNMILKP